MVSIVFDVFLTIFMQKGTIVFVFRQLKRQVMALQMPKKTALKLIFTGCNAWAFVVKICK